MYVHFAFQQFIRCLKVNEHINSIVYQNNTMDRLEAIAFQCYKYLQFGCTTTLVTFPFQLTAFIPDFSIGNSPLM